jgi:hypothetical protein
MDQIIKLTTQMATTAITQIMIEKIITNAKNLHENGDFDFDTFFTAENISQLTTMEKMKITDARKILNVNGKKTKKDLTKPKKFNGYLLFCHEERSKLKEEDEFKDAEFVNIAKELGTRWRNLTEDEKIEWKEKAIQKNKIGGDDSSDNESKKITQKKTTKKKKKNAKKKKKSPKKKKKKLEVIEEFSSDEENSPSEFSYMSDSDEE